MSSTDDGESTQRVQRGRKAGRSVSGAPFPARAVAERWPRAAYAAGTHGTG